MNDEYDELTDEYDTWWFVYDDCPECGSAVASNGLLRTCRSCEWWEKIDE